MTNILTAIEMCGVLVVILFLVPRIVGTLLGHRAAKYIRHKGLHVKHAKSLLEGIYSGRWKEINAASPSALECILGGDVPRLVTQDEATTAATVIQWLGSTDGHKFVVGCLEKAGWQVVLGWYSMDSKDSGPCTHPLVQLQTVAPGTQWAWRRCMRCGETFSTELTPKDLTVRVGRGRPAK